MYLNFDELADKWIELNERKSAYRFNLREFEQETFVKLVKDSLASNGKSEE